MIQHQLLSEIHLTRVKSVEEKTVLRQMAGQRYWVHKFVFTGDDDSKFTVTVFSSGTEKIEWLKQSGEMSYEANE